MLADLTQKARETWREITDEQDTVRRSVLRTRLVLVGMVLVVLTLWLLTKLDKDQLGIIGSIITVLFNAFLVVWVCWTFATLVRRAQYRLASMGRPAGILRAAIWSFVEGDASIRLACLLSILLLAQLWVGNSKLSGSPFAFVFVITILLTAGALPKDRSLAGRAPDASAVRKFVWVLVGLLCGAVVAGGLLTVLRCDCSLSNAAALMVEPLFFSTGLFGFCLMGMNRFDPFALRRINVAWGAKPSRSGSEGERAGSRPSPG